MANILVCIGGNKAADALINEAKKYVKGENDKLFIVNINSYETYYISGHDNDKELEHLYLRAVEAGADFKMIRSNDIVKSVCKYIEEKEIDRVIVEDTGELRSLKQLKKVLAEKEKLQNVKVSFEMVG